jgi:flagellar FliL protein
MADEVVEEEEGGGKGGLIKIILLVVGILLLVALTIGGTLFLSGFFEADEEAAAEAAVAALEAIASEESAAAAAALAGPDRVKIDSPELTRYEQTYFEIESEMTSNLNNSRKVMQVKVYIMTHYDERVIAHMEKHDMPVRSALMRIMASKTEADLARPTFRKELAEEFRLEVNSILERLEDFGGVESVGFTAFVVQ